MTGRRAGQIAVALVIVGLIAFWIFVFVIAEPVNDELTDPNYAPAAQAVCRTAVDELKREGLVEALAETPQQRAELAEKADAVLAVQVQQLRAIQPADEATRNATSAWLTDWDTWLRDRAAWVAKLRNGEDAPFLETQDEKGTPSSAALNIFARVNEMPDCATPLGI